MLYLLVNIRFQVLFHSPPGVLFTVPSQYYSLSVTRSYLGLGDGPPAFTPDFSCPVLLWIPTCLFQFRIRDYYPVLSGFPAMFSYHTSRTLQSEPRCARTPVWALPISLAATLGIDCFFLFLRVLRCFSSPGSPHTVMYSLYGIIVLPMMCFHIRISTDHSSFATPRSFSQLITSFIGS